MIGMRIIRPGDREGIVRDLIDSANSKHDRKIEKTIPHESPCGVGRTRIQRRSEDKKVKQERAQGGCLGTESR